MDFDSSSKIVGPHQLHGSQYGYLDPIDTPDGGNVGLHKNMAMMCSITIEHKASEILKWINTNMSFINLKTIEH